MTRPIVLGFALLPVLLLPALAVSPPAASADDAPAQTQEELPLRRVLLFTSGVGYFEHDGKVDGDARVDLTFNVDDVNDLLKSMIVQDLGGGRISTVTYGSRDPVSKALSSFAVDLTENLTLADLLKQVRGEKVYVETPMPVTGTIVSVETRKEKVKDEVSTVDFLNLLTPDGLKSVSFDSIRSVRLLDDRLDKEMRQALEILSTGRDEKRKTVTLEFLGKGERDVRVGYVQETPLWKTSYRLVLDEEKKPFLQGWAIVQNTTDQDWDGVSLTLVSGQPISYVMNLYQPLYANRPVVEPELPPGVRPQAYARELEQLEKAAQSQGGRGGLRRRARSEEPARDARAAPSARPGAAPAEGGLDLARGVEAAARGAELGELFQYVIDQPVTLARQRSAMLPILNATTDGEKLSIYDAAVQPEHPLNGVRIHNSTGLHLMQGPVTVFDGGAYAGDALIQDTPPGATQLISYAIDMEVQVGHTTKSQPDELTSVKLVKGLLESKVVRRRATTYLAKNEDTKPRKLLIVRPLDADWQIVGPVQPEEKTRNAARFGVDLDAGETKKLEVVEEQTVRQQIGISNVGSGTITYYLQSPVVSTAVKQALTEVAKQKQAIDDLQSQIREISTTLKRISDEQARIRANMGQIDHGSDLYARYLKKFSAQEDEIEAQQKRMQALRDEAEQKTRALQAYLMGLDVE